MKKYFLMMISFILLLTSCIRAGGLKEIRASKLDMTPVLENKSTSISGFVITYYNVYRMKMIHLFLQMIQAILL